MLLKAEYRQAGKDFAPSLFAGPAVAFKTSCRLDAEADAASVSDECPADTINSTDWSLIFGLGFEYSRFVFQARTEDLLPWLRELVRDPAVVIDHVYD